MSTHSQQTQPEVSKQEAVEFQVASHRRTQNTEKKLEGVSPVPERVGPRTFSVDQVEDARALRFTAELERLLPGISSIAQEVFTELLELLLMVERRLDAAQQQIGGAQAQQLGAAGQRLAENRATTATVGAAAGASARPQASHGFNSSYSSRRRSSDGDFSARPRHEQPQAPTGISCPSPALAAAAAAPSAAATAAAATGSRPLFMGEGKYEEAEQRLEPLIFEDCDQPESAALRLETPATAAAAAPAVAEVDSRAGAAAVQATWHMGGRAANSSGCRQELQQEAKAEAGQEEGGQEAGQQLQEPLMEAPRQIFGAENQSTATATREFFSLSTSGSGFCGSRHSSGSSGSSDTICFRSSDISGSSGDEDLSAAVAAANAAAANAANAAANANAAAANAVNAANAANAAASAAALAAVVTYFGS